MSNNLSQNIMEQMIFITGFARGGTSWLRDCIGCHPDVAILPKERTIFRDIENYDDIPELLEPEVSKLLQESKYVVNKAPANAPFIAKASKFFENTKFLFIIRDPRDVLTSHQRGTKSWMKGKNSTVEGCMEKVEKYFNGFELAKNQKNLKLIRYEDLHQNFLETMNDILEFLNLNTSTKIIKNIYKEVNFKAQTSRANKENQNSAKRKGVVGDWGICLTNEDKDWFKGSKYFQNFFLNNNYDFREITYENIVLAMKSTGANFLSEKNLLNLEIDFESLNVVAQHDIDYLNKDFCFESVLKTAEIESELQIAAEYNFLPLDDSRYSHKGKESTIALIHEVQKINPRAFIGLHVNACERFYSYDAPDDPEGKYLPEIIDYLIQQVNDYRDNGIEFSIATSHGYTRGKKVPNNRDTPEISKKLKEYGILLFDTEIREKLKDISSYQCAITDVGGILKPKRLGSDISLVNENLYKNMPKGTFLRFLTHPGNYHVSKPSVVAMRTF